MSTKNKQKTTRKKFVSILNLVPGEMCVCVLFSLQNGKPMALLALGQTYGRARLCSILNNHSWLLPAAPGNFRGYWPRNYSFLSGNSCETHGKVMETNGIPIGYLGWTVEIPRHLNPRQSLRSFGDANAGPLVRDSAIPPEQDETISSSVVHFSVHSILGWPSDHIDVYSYVLLRSRLVDHPSGWFASDDGPKPSVVWKIWWSTVGPNHSMVLVYLPKIIYLWNEHSVTCRSPFGTIFRS